MNCPRCETTPLTERDRDGITLDACPACRGLWLDRGELEKLIARATREFEDAGEGRRTDESERSYRRDHDDDRFEDRRPYQQQQLHHHSGKPQHPRKRGWMESLGDLFD